MEAMNQSALAPLAMRLAAHLDCTQDVACRHIMQALVETGQPVSLMHLATRLQMSQEKLAAHLACVPDTEFDEQGHIVGWGITLLPTQHQFVLSELPLFTWCAFDTVLFPPLLQVEAHVQSECSASGQPITFVATRSAGIADLLPATSVLSLLLPTERCDCVRGTFCEQSLFFQSEEAASSWMALHPDAVLLSVEEAAVLGHMVAEMWPHKSTASSGGSEQTRCRFSVREKE
jgi:alkylmercury lyase